MFSHEPLKCPPFFSGSFGGTADVTFVRHQQIGKIGALECLDYPFFGELKRTVGIDGGFRVVVEVEIIRLNRVGVTENQGPLNNAFQFAYVARPRVVHEPEHGAARE